MNKQTPLLVDEKPDDDAPSLLLARHRLDYRLGANSDVRKHVDLTQLSESFRQLGLYSLVLHEWPPEPAA